MLKYETNENVRKKDDVDDHEASEVNRSESGRQIVHCLNFIKCANDHFQQGHHCTLNC